MVIFDLKTMIKGWFVGSFIPTAFKTDACEVAVKTYKSGDLEDAHYHKKATEITLIFSGEVVMCDRKLNSGNIIVLSPGEITSFEALSDTVCVVVKIPGAKNDKFFASNHLN